MKSILKYPGAKWNCAEWIVSFFPPHKFYLEPFFGSGAVFFAKQPSRFETINDLDNQVVNFFKVCREAPEKLARAIALTPFSRKEFLDIQENHAGEEINLSQDNIENARRFAVRCCQGFGAKLGDRVGWKNTKKPNGPDNPQVWSGIPQQIRIGAERLKNAQIESVDAVQLITACNDKDCLIYADPPYLEKTRGKRMYRVEMLEQDAHGKLLDALLAHKGFVVLSGYENEFYNSKLAGWTKRYKECRANNAGKREEVLWMNFEPEITFFDSEGFVWTKNKT